MKSARAGGRRNIRILIIILSALAMAAPQATAGIVAKYKSSGAWASVYGSSDCLLVWLQVSRAGTSTARETWLYYDIYDSCSQSTIGYGYGRIANTDLSVSKGKAVLDTDTSANASFTTFGPAGRITVRWTQNGSYSNTFSGHHRTEYGDTVVHGHGSRTEESADAAGSIAGMEIPLSAAWLGSARDMTVQVERRSTN